MLNYMKLYVRYKLDVTTINKPCSVGRRVGYVQNWVGLQTATGFIRSGGVAGGGLAGVVLLRTGRLDGSSLLLGRLRRLSLDFDPEEEEEELPSFLVCFRLLRDPLSLWMASATD